ncbi:MAG: hypothetical protein NDI82_05150 [Anaeromyxobacteraceae bacterium]|nr:hypothetical protein [Anaeromyxobacteraceae bacterium]
MELEEFARRLAARLPALGGAELAVSLLWWRNQRAPGVAVSAGDLAREMTRLGLGAPHSTRLGQKLARSGLTLRSNGAFRLKADAGPKIAAMLDGILEPQAPDVPSDREYLPEPVWKQTRGYIEAVCTQLNGCYFSTYYDAASVMARRLVETLLIEAYEKLGREALIKTAEGNYWMLGDIVDHALGTDGLSSVGREGKKALRSVKQLGDRSAHNRRFIARRHDMDDLRSDLRVLADELIAIAELRRRG